MRIVIDLTDEQTEHVRSLARKARRNGDADVTVKDVKADIEAACLDAVKATAWEWEQRALAEQANADRRDAAAALDALFPAAEPEPEPDA